MKYLIALALILLCGVVYAADDTAKTDNDHNVQSGGTAIAAGDDVVGCVFKIPKGSYKYLRHVGVRVYNNRDRNGTADSIRAAIYRNSDLSLVSRTVTYVKTINGAYNDSVWNLAFIDSVALKADSTYIVAFEWRTAAYYQFKSEDSTGDTVKIDSHAWGTTGMPDPLVVGSTTANKRLKATLWLGTTSNSYGLTHHISFSGETADTITFKDSLTFIGIGAASYDSTMLFVKNVTAPPTSTLFSAPTGIDTSADTLDFGDVVVPTYRIGGMTDFAAACAIVFSDTTHYASMVGADTVDTIFPLVDTSDIVTYPMGIAADTFTMVVQESLAYGDMYVASIMECAPAYSFGEIAELMVRALTTDSNDVRTLIYPVEFDTLTADSVSTLSCYLDLTTTADTADLWTGTTTIRVQIAGESFGELMPGTTTGYPSWAKRTAAANWTDSGAGLRYSPYIDFACDTTPHKTYTIDVGHLVAWARYHNVPVAFVLEAVDNKCWEGTRKFYSDDALIDMSKRPKFTFTGTRKTRVTPVKYVGGPTGSDVVSGPDGPSTVGGGFGE